MGSEDCDTHDRDTREENDVEKAVVWDVHAMVLRFLSEKMSILHRFCL